MNGNYFGIDSFYFYFFIFMTIYVIICKELFSKNRKLFVFSCFLLLYLMAAMRGVTVGGDLKRYLPEFHWLANSSLKDMWEYGHHEPGYMLYVMSLGLISDSDRCFLIGTSLAALIGPFFMFYKHSKQPAISLLLYYSMGAYTNTFNNVRQSIAISIIFCSLTFLLNRDLKKYVVGILIASTFHYSAAIMLVVYPLCKKALNVEKIVLYAGVGLSIVLLMGYSLMQFVVMEFLTKYDPESFSEEGDGAGYGLFILYALIFITISLFYLFKKKELSEKQQQILSLFIIFQMFAMIIQLSAPIFHSMVRMTQYFFIPVVTLAIPYIHYVLKDNLYKFIYYVIIFIFAVYNMIRVYSCAPNYQTNSQGVIPYVFIETTIF